MRIIFSKRFLIFLAPLSGGFSHVVMNPEKSVRVCLKNRNSAAARDFGRARDGAFRASPKRAVRNGPTKRTGKSTAAGESPFFRQTLGTWRRLKRYSAPAVSSDFPGQTNWPTFPWKVCHSANANLNNKNEINSKIKTSKIIPASPVPWSGTGWTAPDQPPCLRGLRLHRQRRRIHRQQRSKSGFHR